MLLRLRIQLASRTPAPVHIAVITSAPSATSSASSAIMEIHSILELIGQGMDGCPRHLAEGRIVQINSGRSPSSSAAAAAAAAASRPGHSHAHRRCLGSVAGVHQRRLGPDRHNFLRLGTGMINNIMNSFELHHSPPPLYHYANYNG